MVWPQLSFDAQAQVQHGLLSNSFGDYIANMMHLSAPSRRFDYIPQRGTRDLRLTVCACHERAQSNSSPYRPSRAGEARSSFKYTRGRKRCQAVLLIFYENCYNIDKH
jgi:hypothetical protein